jgi:hypothetical protein
MHPVVKFIILGCGWVVIACVFSTIAMSPLLLRKGMKRYPRATDIRAIRTAEPRLAWICRTLLWLRVIGITAAIIAGLLLGISVARVVFATL